MKKLDQSTFREESWELVTHSQQIQSILTAIGVKDDEYCSMYILTGVDEALISTSGSTSLLEVWAGWHEKPCNGRVYVCLFDRGAAYTEQRQ